MSNQRKSKVGINVGIVCLVSILGTNALNLTFPSPAAACGGWLNACPPKRPTLVRNSDPNLPNFQGRNIDGCAHEYRYIAEGLDRPEITLCSQEVRDMIADAFCRQQGMSRATTWNVREDSWENRRPTWKLLLSKPVPGKYKVVKGCDPYLI